MQNRFVHLALFFIACCFPSVAIADNSCRQDTVSPETKDYDPSVIREQLSRSRFVRITFLDDSCDTTCPVNKGIQHFELREYVKSQTEKLNQMSLEILKVFSKEQLAVFNKGKNCPVLCNLTVLKDGKIANVSLIIPARFSDETSDRELRDIKEIITHTHLDEIPYDTSAVGFLYGVPRKLIAQLLKTDK